MQARQGTKQKVIKVLKCTKCGKEYIYDSASQRCPECRGNLQVRTVIR